MSEGPYRRYTELSARTLACYLASLDNAESGLCRNAPRSTSGFTSPGSQRRSRRQSRAQSPLDASNTPLVPKQGSRDEATIDQTLLGGEENGSTSMGNSGHVSSLTHTHAEDDGASDYQGNSTQKMKDPKSFTQNLFDTLSLRMVEWLPLRRSPDASESDHSHLSTSRASTQSPKQEPSHIESQPDKAKTNLTYERVSVPNVSGKWNSRTPSSRTISGQPATVEVKLPNQHVKRLSLTESETWRQNPRLNMEEKSRHERKQTRKVPANTHSDTNGFISLPSPPAIKHRSRNHRGKDADKDNASTNSQHKKHRRVSWNGSKMLNDSLCPETKEPAQPSRNQQTADEPISDEFKSKRNGERYHIDTSPTVQTGTHLTSDIVDGLGQIMIQSDEEAQKWEKELADIELSGSFDNPEWQFATSRQQQAFSFMAQTVFYALSSTKQLLRSFRKSSAADGQGKSKASNVHLDIRQLQPSFRRLFEFCPRDIAFHSLWNALEKLFVPPKEVFPAINQSRRSSRNSNRSSPDPIVPRQETESAKDEHLSDHRAAYVGTVALFALVSSVPEVDTQTWRGILQMRSAGTLAPDNEMRKLPTSSAQVHVNVTDALEHELALRLVGRFVRAITARLAYNEISKTRQIYTHDLPKQRPSGVLDLILDNLSEHESIAVTENEAYSSQQPGPAAVVVEWLRTLFLKEWDGNPEIARSGAAGGAVQILASMYKERGRLGLVPEDFHTPFLSERLDPMDMPIDWLNRVSNNKTMHLLSYSFLFPPSALVTYFRALDYSAMSRYYESAMTTTRHVTQTAFNAIRVNDDVGLLARMKTSMSAYLVLVVSRDNVLMDALNQLWRREKRELMRPLKVQMGMDEGEEGVDHGGVQQEFFRVVMAEALDSSYGMFITNDRTRMSWFQPCALEPLYKFELLGLLMSLAVYNGLTLPVSFPIALYRKLLGLKVRHLDHIRDGWPELAGGLDELLKWEDGDVGDVFMRTYEFSFEAFGTVKTADMLKIDRDAAWPSEPTQPKGWNTPFGSTEIPPSPPSGTTNEMAGLTIDDEVGKTAGETRPFQPPTPTDEAPLVTNQNRHQFVKDYIFWLTDKSVRAQYEAFARGFYTCLDRSALSIFTPEALKSVIEGIQEIDMDELERHARYEGGFGPMHRSVRDFWSIAKRFSPEKRAHLLEFVTASDRVPVNGIESIMFVVQRNGVDDDVSLGVFFYFWNDRLTLLDSASRQV